MKALCWHGTGDVRVDTVPDPVLVHARDAILQITATAICGSDLHLYDGYHADHEIGRYPRPRIHGRSRRSRQRSQQAESRRPRRRALYHCLRRVLLLPEGADSLCDISNPNAEAARKVMGHSPVGPVRLLAHAGRLRRGPGGIRARAVCRCRSDQRSRPGSATSRCCSFATSSPPAIWPPKIAASSRATRSRFGAADRSANLRFKAPGCSAQGE